MKFYNDEEPVAAGVDQYAKDYCKVNHVYKIDTNASQGTNMERKSFLYKSLNSSFITGKKQMNNTQGRYYIDNNNEKDSIHLSDKLSLTSSLTK